MSEKIPSGKLQIELKDKVETNRKPLLENLDRRREEEKEWQKEIKDASLKCRGTIIKDPTDGAEYLFPKTGLEVNFIEPKLRFTPEELPEGLNQSLFSDEVNPEFREDMNTCFGRMEDFLTGPIIADDLSAHKVLKKEGNKFVPIRQAEEHIVRRLWELKYDSYHLRPETEHYYHSNRLISSLANSVKSLFQIFSIRDRNMIKAEKGPLFKDPLILEKLKIIVDKLPDELKEADVPVYKKSELKNKIKIMEEAAPVILEAVDLLGEPRKLIKYVS